MPAAHNLQNLHRGSLAYAISGSTLPKKCVLTVIGVGHEQHNISYRIWSVIGSYRQPIEDKTAPSSANIFFKCTERGCLSVTRFCYSFLSELRGPAWAVGTYSIGHSAGGTSQNMICKTLRQIDSPTLYCLQLSSKTTAKIFHFSLAKWFFSCLVGGNCQVDSNRRLSKYFNH